MQKSFRYQLVPRALVNWSHTLPAPLSWQPKGLSAHVQRNEKTNQNLPHRKSFFSTHMLVEMVNPYFIFSNVPLQKLRFTSLKTLDNLKDPPKRFFEGYSKGALWGLDQEIAQATVVLEYCVFETIDTPLRQHVLWYYYACRGILAPTLQRSEAPKVAKGLEYKLLPTVFLLQEREQYSPVSSSSDFIVESSLNVFAFDTKVTEIKIELNLSKSKENILTRENPLTFEPINIQLDLEEPVTKSETSKPVLKALALEAVNNRYPPEEWLHIYTDGSTIDNNSGSGITCALFSFYQPAGYHTTNFDAEITAIHISLQHLLYGIDKFQNAVILSDSKAALYAINSYKMMSIQIKECHKMIQQFQNYRKKFNCNGYLHIAELLEMKLLIFLPKKDPV
ncbi:hypothetical protein ANN_03732 [Periplaneta americana]|uniref:RNase H type-1 domain-containing protein n=1 Tax=Periplaneta americana TaxID=6978 RepID=A0ABQ8TZT6_PERAM|nr:hypothetical protein ANN_03732 [Periplaneta americana]